jgi:PAS domain S-box-containing protein
MVKINFSIGHAILVVAGLSWGFVIAQREAFSAYPALGWAAAAVFTILLAIYAYRLWVSERMKKAAIERSEELEHVRMAMNEHCLITVVDQNRKLTSVNDGHLKVTGFDRSEMLGRDLAEFLVETTPGLLEKIGRRLKAGKIWSGEVKLACKDGSFLWTHTTISPRFDHIGRYLGSISVRTDITERKIAVEEREIISILNKLKDDVFIFEPDTFRLRYMNDSAMALVGWGRDIYEKKTVLDIDPKFDRDKLEQLLAPLLAGTQEQARMQADLIDGPYDIFVQLIRAESGVDSFVAIFRDISEKVEVERIKDEFVSTVSHELRTPITSIKGALGLVMPIVREELSESARNLVSIAHRNADRLALIVDDILDLEKIATGHMKFDFQRGDLRALIEEAVQVNSGFGKRFDVTTRADVPDQPALAKIDTNRMLQVMSNLLSNAAKFSKPGGEVVVSLDREDDHYWINVKDSGVGISDAEIDKIFDRFCQANNHTERSGKGTGLGLSIVKIIMEKHGGDVKVTSKLGSGSTFSLKLPADETMMVDPPMENPTKLAEAV